MNYKVNLLNSLQNELSEVKASIQLAKESNIKLSQEYQLQAIELENKIRRLKDELNVNQDGLSQEEKLILMNNKRTELYRKHRRSKRKCKVDRNKREKLYIFDSKEKRFFKKFSNAKVRLTRGLFGKSNLYKKVCDLAWKRY